jgi:hypothetical protein
LEGNKPRVGKEMSKDLEERYNEGKLEGMFAAYDVFETQLGKLRGSLDDVWNIYDHSDSLDNSSEEQKAKLAFAMHTLFVLAQMFEDGYDEHLWEVKAGMRNYDNAF